MSFSLDESDWQVEGKTILVFRGGGQAASGQTGNNRDTKRKNNFLDGWEWMLA